MSALRSREGQDWAFWRKVSIVSPRFFVIWFVLTVPSGQGRIIWAAVLWTGFGHPILLLTCWRPQSGIVYFPQRKRVVNLLPSSHQGRQMGSHQSLPEDHSYGSLQGLREADYREQ